MRYTTEGSQYILTADQRQFYEDNGFLVIRRLVSQDKLDTFYERFKQVCRKEVKVSTCRYITIKHTSVTSCNVTKCNAIYAIMLQKCFNVLWFTSEATSQTLWASETTKFIMTILGTQFMYPFVWWVRVHLCNLDIDREATIYWEIFASLYFHKFREFCSVTIHKNFTKVLPCHTSYVAHMDHSRKIPEIVIFTKI